MFHEKKLLECSICTQPPSFTSDIALVRHQLKIADPSKYGTIYNQSLVEKLHSRLLWYTFIFDKLLNLNFNCINFLARVLKHSALHAVAIGQT